MLEDVPDLYKHPVVSQIVNGMVDSAVQFKWGLHVKNKLNSQTILYYFAYAKHLFCQINSQRRLLKQASVIKMKQKLAVQNLLEETTSEIWFYHLIKVNLSYL